MNNPFQCMRNLLNRFANAVLENIHTANTRPTDLIADETAGKIGTSEEESALNLEPSAIPPKGNHGRTQSQYQQEARQETRTKAKARRRQVRDQRRKELINVEYENLNDFFGKYKWICLCCISSFLNF